MLVKIYVYICEKFEQSLQYECQRFTNNDQPDFTDQEMITITYLRCIIKNYLKSKTSIDTPRII